LKTEHPDSELPDLAHFAVALGRICYTLKGRFEFLSSHPIRVLNLHLALLDLEYNSATLTRDPSGNGL
jgi:hypothetical protein